MASASMEQWRAGAGPILRGLGHAATRNRVLAAGLLGVSLAISPGAVAEPAPARQILFVGNSFFHGQYAPALHYNAAAIVDLNGTGYGGVPGIFKQLTVEAGLDYAVAMEAASGQALQYHYQTKLAKIGSRAWDVVVLAELSTLDAAHPGDPANLIDYAARLERYVHGADNPHANPRAQVYLMQTWPRADQLYGKKGGHWYGQTAEQMADVLRAAYATAAAQDGAMAGVLPVGDAFVRAIASGVADRDPSDGIDAGKVSVWNVDHFHASAWGSYLEALVIFGRVTGVDPRTLGGESAAARGLQLSSAQAEAAQKVAHAQLLAP